jgi:HME family heavy-metal exporter
VIGALVRTSLHYRVAVIAAAGLMLLVGLLAGAGLDIDVLPDINRPTLTVMVEAPALAAEEIETLVTRPIELALTGLPSTLRIRTTSAVGLSIINVELDWGADVLSVRQQAAERLAAVGAQLPAGVVPQIQPISSIMGEIMLVALTARRETSPMTLRGLADWVVRPRLAIIPGVSQVTVIGGEVEHFRVAPRLAVMAGLDISVAELERALARFGTSAGGGFVADGSTEFVIRAIGSRPDLGGLGNLVVAMRDATPVLLRQIADIAVAAKPARGSAGVDGEPAVIVSVQKQPAADTRAVTQSVAAALTELQRSMPAGTQVDRVIFKQADFIEAALDNVGRALVESILVVALVLFLFLGNVRTTLISLTAIPLSLVAALLVFRGFGLSVNTMTLGGLAVAMGELVDDAVVGVENVFRRLKENRARSTPRPAFAVIAEASEEVRSGILYATAIIILVLAPLFAIAGIEGRLFAPLASAYVVALAASLLTAITVTPVLCLMLLPGARVLERPDAPLMRLLKRGLARALPWTFARSRAVLGCAGCAVALAALLLATLPRSLMPPFNEGSITVELSATPGITLAESSRLGAIAERLLLQVPEVSWVGRRTGRAELDEHAQGVQTSEIDVRLKPSARARNDIVADIRRRLSILPAAVNIGQPISHRIEHLLSGVRAQIVVKVFGDDLDMMAGVAERLRGPLAAVPGLVDLQVERRSRIPAVEVRADERRSAIVGTTPAAITEAVSTLAGGRAIAQISEGLRRTDLTLRLDERDRTSAGLARVLLETPSGRVPVRTVATVAETDGLSQIDRENGRRRLALYANVEGADVSRAVAAVREALDRLDLPTGYSVSLEGGFVGQEQATQRVVALGLLSLAAIFLLLLGRYRSPALALIVMANVPLALIGGVAALALIGLPLSLASVVGFVTLAGISIRNGILKVSHYLNLGLFENVSFGDDLILRGSLERLAPVLMTAAAASLGLVPLLTDADAPGKEILYPVAVVVFGGLISATVLDTFLTPILFRLFGARPLARLRAARERGDQAGSL